MPPNPEPVEQLSPAELRRLVDGLRAEVTRLREETARLQEENTALKGEIARLKGLPGRFLPQPSCSRTMPGLRICSAVWTIRNG